MSNTVGLQLFYNGIWNDVPLYSAGQFSITRGTASYTDTWPRPAVFTCEINNDSLAYDPDRPESVLYGVAGVSTPARLSVQGSVRLSGEATAYVPDRTPEHQPGQNRGRSWIQFTASGPLERIGNWTDVVQSPMLKTISARSTSLGHWHLEDGTLARALTNTLPGGAAGTVKGAPSFGESTRPYGALQTVKLSADSQLSGTFKPASGTAGWQVGFSFLAATIPASGYVRVYRWTASNGYTWTVDMGNVSWQITATAPDGTVLLTSVPGYGSIGPNAWITMRVKATVSAGTVSYDISWYRQGAGSPAGVSGTFAGSVGALGRWFQDGSAGVAGSWLSHVFGVTGVTDNLLDYNSVRAFDAYVGERAGERYARVAAAELDTTAYVTGAYADSPQMGPQPPGTVVEILKECVRTDGGRLDDVGTVLGTVFVTRRSMMGRDPKLTLAYPSQIALGFKPAPGRAYTANVVTVKNRDAGERTVAVTSGPLSTLAPPNGVNEMKASVDVNMANEGTDLAYRAQWEAARGTVAGRQFVEVTVNLLAGTVTHAAVIAVVEGDHILITGYPPDDIHLWVTGIRENGGAVERTVTFECESYEIMRVPKWADGVWRWGAGQLALSGAQTPTSTSWTVTSPNLADMLTPGAGPLDFMVAGERITVTTIGAVSGTGPYSQTLTGVVRSVNAVIKAQLTGAGLTVYNARRWGL